MKKISLVFLLAFPIVFLIWVTLRSPEQIKKPDSNVIDQIEAQNNNEIVDEIAKTIQDGDMETALSLMVEQLKHPDIPTSKGEPLVTLAAEANNYDLVAYLVDFGCNVDAIDNKGETALIKAARNGNRAIIEKLLSVNANVNIKSLRGITALTEAAEGQHGQITTFLLSRGAIAGVSEENLLRYAFDKNYVGINAMLLGGANANYADANGNTALIIVCSYGDLAAVNTLTAYKANVNAANKYGMTPLLYAIKGGHDEITRTLINRKGTDIDKANNNGQTPLFYAAYTGNTPIAQDLLELGADYKKADNKGVTPLVAAQRKGNKETAEAISKFITFKNLPRDEQGRIIAKDRQTSAPTQKDIAAQKAQEQAVKRQEEAIKKAQEEQAKAEAQTKAMQEQMAKSLTFGEQQKK